MRFETGRSFANEAQDDAPIAPNEKNEGENAKKTIPSLGKERVGQPYGLARTPTTEKRRACKTRR